MGMLPPIYNILFDIKEYLDSPLENGTKQKIVMLYAYNASGKTRLSQLFHEFHGEGVLYYNAFTEDLFSWDNEVAFDNYTLKIDQNAWIFKVIEKQGLHDRITENFQKFTGSTIVPILKIPMNQITFRIYSDYLSYQTVKISRGEESIFIWSVFYTIMDEIINILNEEPENDDFDDIEYVVIDDPVSSMDDTRIIMIALELAKLIKQAKNNRLKFLITTHHALFFNVLYNEKNKEWDRKNYILSKASGESYTLKNQSEDSPFAYHHVIISDIEEAMNKKNIKRYHFNLFRALLEKTANFLGYSQSWSDLLSKKYRKKPFTKYLNHYSHSRLSDLEPKDLPDNDKKDFEEAFKSFITDFRWYKNYD